MSLTMIDVLACFMEAAFCVLAAAVLVGIVGVGYTFVKYMQSPTKKMSFPEYFEKIWH